jgi:hypothetical protein
MIRKSLLRRIRFTGRRIPWDNAFASKIGQARKYPRLMLDCCPLLYEYLFVLVTKWHPCATSIRSGLIVRTALPNTIPPASRLAPFISIVRGWTFRHLLATVPPSFSNRTAEQRNLREACFVARVHQTLRVHPISERKLTVCS